MNPHPKIRKTVKWGGAAVTVLLGVVWIGSGWWNLTYRTSGGLKYLIAGGAFGIERPSYVPGFVLNSEWNWERGKFSRYWLPEFHSFAKTWNVFLPLWMPAGVAAAIMVFAGHLDTPARRRARLNLCPKCNYDRSGLAAGAVCPECGEGSTAG